MRPFHRFARLAVGRRQAPPGGSQRRDESRRHHRFAMVGLVALAVLLGASSVASAQRKKERKVYIVDRVVAVVNDSIILSSELDVRLLPLLPDLEGIDDPEERQRRLDKLRGQMLEEMINEELIVQAATEARIEVEAADVNAALDEIKKQNDLDDAQFAEALAAQGYSLAAYKNDLRRQLTRLKAVNQLVRSRVNITDDDVRARYDAMVRRSESVSAIQLSHILVSVPDKPTEAQVSAAKEKAAAAIQRVKAGEDFAAVAAEVSDDLSTKSTGGELGWFERGTLSPEWEAVVFSMEKGEIRGPISGPKGLHVFYVAEVKRTEIKSFEELKEQIRGELTRREMDKQSQLWIEELRRKAYIDNKLW
jgi:parvulin-like peptidyl-prolyl isomerase